MKIMQLIPSFEIGGAETMCEGLCKQLTKMGHRVVAVSLSSSRTVITRRLEEAGVTVAYLDKGPGMDLGCVRRLKKLIVEEEPQVIHTHLHALKYAALTFPQVPIIHTVHNEAAKEVAPVDQKIAKYLFTHGKALPVALSSRIQESVSALYGLPPEAVPVVHNGIDLSRCMEKTEYALHYPMRLIHVGRFYPQKNHDAILEALAILKKRGIRAQVSFFGDGPRMGEIQAKAEKMELGKLVSFEGVCDNVFPHLSHGDAFILPSKWEGSPMTVIEAMGTGLPVVASDVGGLRDMVTSGEDGLLIAPTGEALAQAIETLAKNEDLREKLGKKAKISAQRFRVEQMALDYEALYEQGRTRP